MPTVHKCRIKMDVTATRWEKHGDHPAVLQVPDNVNINGVTDKNLLGMLTNEQNQGTIFGGPIWIIDTGARTFPVDDNYFNDFYEIIPEPTQEITNESVSE